MYSASAIVLLVFFGLLDFESLSLLEVAILLLLVLGLAMVFVDLVDDVSESSLYILTGHGGSLDVADAHLLRILLGLCFAHFPLVVQVAFVPHQKYYYILGCSCLDLFHPFLDVVEGFLFAYVEHDDGSYGSFVVGMSYSAVSFLAGSVPNLCLHH